MTTIKRAVALLLFSMQAMSHEEDNLEKVSLLRDYDYRLDGATNLKIKYSKHMRKIRLRDESEIVRFDNPKYAETVYTVIPSEILRCMNNDCPYWEKGHNSAGYTSFTQRYSNDGYIMEFHERDGFVPVAKYTASNYNYLLLMNVFGSYRYCLEQNKYNKSKKVTEFSDSFVETEAKRILENTENRYDKSMMDDAVKDITFYMNKLDLYNFVAQLFTDKIQNKEEDDMEYPKWSEANIGYERYRDPPVTREEAERFKLYDDLTHELFSSEHAEWSTAIYRMAKMQRKEYEDSTDDSEVKYLGIVINDLKICKTEREKYSKANASYRRADKRIREILALNGNELTNLDETMDRFIQILNNEFQQYGEYIQIKRANFAKNSVETQKQDIQSLQTKGSHSINTIGAPKIEELYEIKEQEKEVKPIKMPSLSVNQDKEKYSDADENKIRYMRSIFPFCIKRPNNGTKDTSATKLYTGNISKP